MVIIGDKVRFDPLESMRGLGACDSRGNTVTGNVVYINHEHKWFLVEYGKSKTRISFKFCDIGKAVKICG